MLEHIPLISEDNLKYLGENEVRLIAANAYDILLDVEKRNPQLTRAVSICAETAGENVTSDRELKADIAANCIVAILLILRLIDRALESQKLEAMLNNGTK